jgi:uncharacterized pyridoxal phosphate-containing UPF0001 family protein
MTAKRHNKEEILELYKACQEKLGEPPGIERFCKMAKLRKSEVKYYWHCSRDKGAFRHTY